MTTVWLLLRFYYIEYIKKIWVIPIERRNKTKKKNNRCYHSSIPLTNNLKYNDELFETLNDKFSLRKLCDILYFYLKTHVTFFQKNFVTFLIQSVILLSKIWRQGDKDILEIIAFVWNEKLQSEKKNCHRQNYTTKLTLKCMLHVNINN
jgi:hypothetical protein